MCEDTFNLALWNVNIEAAGIWKCVFVLLSKFKNKNSTYLFAIINNPFAMQFLILFEFTKPSVLVMIGWPTDSDCFAAPV